MLDLILDNLAVVIFFAIAIIGGLTDKLPKADSTNRNSTSRNSTSRNSTSRNSTSRNSTNRNSTNRNSTSRNSTSRNSTSRNSTNRNSTNRNSTNRNSTSRNFSGKNNQKKKAKINPKQGLANLLKQFEIETSKPIVKKKKVEKFEEVIEEVEKPVVKKNHYEEPAIVKSSSQPLVNIAFLKENAHSAIILKEILGQPKGLQ